MEFIHCLKQTHEYHISMSKLCAPLPLCNNANKGMLVCTYSFHFYSLYFEGDGNKLKSNLNMRMRITWLHKESNSRSENQAKGSQLSAFSGGQFLTSYLIMRQHYTWQLPSKYQILQYVNVVSQRKAKYNVPIILLCFPFIPPNPEGQKGSLLPFYR